MREKTHLIFLVIFSLSLHHQVQTQKANFCNVTEPYFVEVSKTETILGFKPKPSGFNLIGMLAGNKYENITRTVVGVEKRERVIEECCKGYKKRDNQCVPIDDTKPPKEPSSTSTTTTTTTTAASSSTSTTTAAPAPSEPPPPAPSPETEPVTQPSTSESVPSPEPSAAPVAAVDPTTQTNAVLEPTPAPEEPPPAPSESPITTTSSAPESGPSSEPSSVPEVPPPTSSESPSPAPEPAPSPEPETAPEAPSPAPSESSAIVSSSEVPTQTTAQVSQAESTVSDGRPLDEPMLSSLIVTTNGTPAKGEPITTPYIISYSNSESSTSTKPTPSSEPSTTKQSEKLIDDAKILDIDFTTIINGRRRRRSLDESSDESADSIEVLEFESNTSSDDSNELSAAAHKSELKLDEKTVSVKNHRRSSDSDNIVVSDLTADIEDQGYPWVEIMEVLSFGAIVFLLVITVQMSLNVEPYSLSKGNKKIPQEIDSYGEYWVCDSQSSLEEV